MTSSLGFTGSVRRMIRSLSTDVTPLTFLKKVIAKAGQTNANVAAIASAADGYDDLKIGFKLVK